RAAAAAESRHAAVGRGHLRQQRQEPEQSEQPAKTRHFWRANGQRDALRLPRRDVRAEGAHPVPSDQQGRHAAATSPPRRQLTQRLSGGEKARLFFYPCSPCYPWLSSFFRRMARTGLASKPTSFNGRAISS